MFVAPEDRGLVTARPALWLPDRKIIAPRSMPHPGVSPQAPAKKTPAHATISFVKLQIATTNSVGSITGITSGDFVVQLAFRNNTTPPTRATDWLTPPGAASNGADSMAVTIGDRYSTGTSLAGGTWTNATATIASSTGTHPTAPFSAGFVHKTAAAPPVVIDPLLMAVGNGSSGWSVSCARERPASTSTRPRSADEPERPDRRPTYSAGLRHQRRRGLCRRGSGQRHHRQQCLAELYGRAAAVL
jgi:hypothetical protein